ncbi:MAG: hypothetical protein ACKVSF_06770 [Alphaproteobacteria bacterium]
MTPCAMAFSMVTHATMAAAGALALALAACQGTTQISSTTPEAKQAGNAPSGFAQFTDIPIPEGARMDMERTLILGSQEKWIGRLAIASGASAAAVFDLYQDQMVRFGWVEISAVRSETSVLTFSREERVATIQIQRSTLGSTLIDITVTPRGTKPPKP